VLGGVCGLKGVDDPNCGVAVDARCKNGEARSGSGKPLKVLGVDMKRLTDGLVDFVLLCRTSSSLM
jgi:hypothetical protein